MPTVPLLNVTLLSNVSLTEICTGPEHRFVRRTGHNVGRENDFQFSNFNFSHLLTGIWIKLFNLVAHLDFQNVIRDRMDQNVVIF